MRRIATFLILCGLTLRVGAQPVDVESAERALNDRLLRLAEAQFRSVMESAESDEQKIRARIGLARTLVMSDRAAEAGKVLSELPPMDNPHWIGRANIVAADAALMRGRADKASELLAVTPKLSGIWAEWKIRLEARTLFAHNKSEEAIDLLEGQMQGEQTAPGLQAEFADLLMKSDRREAGLALWEELASGPVARLETQKARLELAKISLEKEDWATLDKQLTALMEDGGVYEELEVEAYPLFIRLYGQRESFDQAVLYLEALEKKVSNPARIADIRTHKADFLIRSEKLEEAGEVLKRLIASEGDHPLASRVQLTLADRLIEAGQPTQAIEAYETYLSVFTDEAGVLEARVGLARLQEKQSLWIKAEMNYGKALAGLPGDSPLRPELKIKLADMAFARGEMMKAFAGYEAFLRNNPEHERAPEVAFQTAVALAKSDTSSLEAALLRLRQLRERYPQSPAAEKAMLQIAVLQQEAGLREEALGSYTSYLNTYPEGVYAPDAMMDKGIVSFQLGFFQPALSQFDQVIREYPKHPRAEQASCLRGWALYLRGKDQEAREAGEAFLTAYPDSIYVADVRLWLGMMAFNKQEYAQSEKEFLALSQRALPVEKQLQAHYLAGRSALALKKYAQALAQFDQVLSLGAESAPGRQEGLPYVMEALFYKGDALTELDQPDKAIVIFDQHIVQYPESYLKYAALGRKGDCQFTLGEQDPNRYLEALNSFQMVAESRLAPAGIQLQALYKQGRTLEALDRIDDALVNYQQVIQLYGDQKKTGSADADVWFIRAVTDAARGFEQLKDYRGAVRVYSQLAETDLPQAEEAKRRIRELRDTHQLLQFQGDNP